jgi:hypothetical protein
MRNIKLEDLILRDIDLLKLYKAGLLHNKEGKAPCEVYVKDSVYDTVFMNKSFHDIAYNWSITATIIDFCREHGYGESDLPPVDFYIKLNHKGIE